MATSDQIKAEIVNKFGFFPPFFSPALHNSQVLENLWQQTLIAYMNNPLSALFKEKLAAYISRFCSVPYCMICHSCTLRPLGMKASEVLVLLNTPLPTVEQFETHLNILKQQPDAALLPEPHSALEESLLICSVFVFLGGEEAELYRTELRRLLGAENYQHLTTFVAYAKTCLVWMEANPEVSYEDDKRVQDHFAALVAEEPLLGKFFLNYREKVKQERQSRAEKLAEIAERQRNQQALLESKERFRKAFDHAPIGMALVGMDDRLVKVNKAFSDMLGYTEEELTQLSFVDITHPEDLETDLLLANQVIAGKIDKYNLEKRYFQKNGDILWVNITSTVIRDRHGKPLYGLGMIEDISERKIAEQERIALLASEQAARAEAERANRSKDEFLAIVSHELRSPLNAILGWAKLLRSRKFDETTTNKALEAIERNSQSQAQLIDDLLDISRIIRGKIRLNLRPVILSSVISAAIETVQLQADAKSIQIVALLDSSVGRILGDSERLQQVVWNLLSNAIKFTPVGGRITIQLKSVDCQAQFSVSDTGIGINPEFLPYVFDRFRQAEAATTKSQAGLGLGLAIVRQLVEMHNGTIDVESSGQGQGTTFIVKIPLLDTTQLDEQETSTLPLSCQPSPLNGLRILVVEDEADIRDYLVTVLQEYGAEVKAIASALQAIETLEQFQPNILISDIGMPEKDGYTLMRQIRTLSCEQGGDIPAVALTAYTREQDRDRAYQAGFQVHVAKPIEPVQLITVVANLAQTVTGNR